MVEISGKEEIELEVTYLDAETSVALENCPVQRLVR